ncbi:MAG: cell division protein FtsZ [Bacteroidales bacterium]|nr:cell division protein FtsZ [Candidatus Cryptobacteroides fimicaballi]
MEEVLETNVTPADWVTSDSIIKVIGVGGGGCNAVSNMFRQKIEGCSFIVCNTDSQALGKSPVPVKIQLGLGLGAGTDPSKGRNAAIEAQDEIARVALDNGTKMLFITAGMGGGTGTGAAPVIAKMAKERGILTVAVVTLPFKTDGDKALERAIDGIRELELNVDSLLIINNQKLYAVYGDLLVHEALPRADEVITTAVRSIIEIIKKEGYINVDFEDVKTMMRNSGMALMGIGEGRGKKRIEDAVKSAFESPLLNDFDLKTAKNVLINITVASSDKGLKMDEMDHLNDLIDEYTGGANNFKRGLIYNSDPDADDTIRITAIATGFKFTKLLGPDIKKGNLIVVGKDFRFEDSNLVAFGELEDIQEERQIGFNIKENSRTFRFDPDAAPALLVREGQDLSDLENTPAIRRILR